MVKKPIKTVREKNRVTGNIIDAIINRKSFLICGHKNPDEDCVSSMIAFALLLTKFDKPPLIYLDGYVPETMEYLLNICKYNSIKLIDRNSGLRKNIDTIVICDTPKGEALDINSKIKKLFNKKGIIKIEIDHHMGTDSEYIGDEDYRLVTEASSSCELIGYLTLKLAGRKEVLKNYLISDPFSRNLVLAIITGIVGDTNMGQYLKSRKEKKYYNIFTATYSDMLLKSTIKDTNFTRIDEISRELHKLTKQEEECHNYIIKREQLSNSIGYTILSRDDMKYLYGKFDDEIIVSVIRHVANEIAEESGKIGMVAYHDNPKTSDLVQFKMRRAHGFKNFDLRDVLELFSISDGGGHEGAIAFRFPQSKIPDVKHYTEDLVKKLKQEIKDLPP